MKIILMLFIAGGIFFNMISCNDSTSSKNDKIQDYSNVDRLDFYSSLDEPLRTDDPSIPDTLYNVDRIFPYLKTTKYYGKLYFKIQYIPTNVLVYVQCIDSGNGKNYDITPINSKINGNYTVFISNYSTNYTDTIKISKDYVIINQ
jgi:hypothetical protein